jgi:3-oxoacyl-[acyl-carrier-protein] synthase II
MSFKEVVITGMGVVSPIGIGLGAFARSLREGRSGVQRFTTLDPTNMPVPFGGEVVGFDPKEYVTPRKSLKVMSREIQVGFAAAQMACQHAGIGSGSVDPERMGVIFGADMIYGDLAELGDTYVPSRPNGKFSHEAWVNEGHARLNPLWLLKNLPNMPACHLAIALDARGPNNSILMGSASSYLAITEAMQIIQRGAADVVVSGGVGTRIHPMATIFHRDEYVSHACENPGTACKPFDRHRDGIVRGEGAGGLVLESRLHAEARGAKILARIVGTGNANSPITKKTPPSPAAAERAIRAVLTQAGWNAQDVGHVNSHGEGSKVGDRSEAQAICNVLGNVPVTALKSYFGTLGAGGGAVEIIASLLSFAGEPVPASLNSHDLDPECPINLIRTAPLSGTQRTAIVHNQTRFGQSVAIGLAAE